MCPSKTPIWLEKSHSIQIPQKISPLSPKSPSARLCTRIRLCWEMCKTTCWQRAPRVYSFQQIHGIYRTHEMCPTVLCCFKIEISPLSHGRVLNTRSAFLNTWARCLLLSQPRYSEGSWAGASSSTQMKSLKDTNGSSKWCCSPLDAIWVPTRGAQALGFLDLKKNKSFKNRCLLSIYEESMTSNLQHMCLKGVRSIIFIQR